MHGQDSVAIVGIGCRYPGGADTPEAFWQLLSSGTDAVREVPADRWNVDAHHDPRPGIPGKTVARRGGFLDAIDRFDADFFGVSPREAELMDPQQRLLLEASWDALEDGGLVLARRGGTPVGVFVGISTNDYSLIQSSLTDLRSIDIYTTTGSTMSIAANRISYALDLRGPSVAVDTACSSSLVALHLAVRSLREGACEVALAGGVNCLILPTPFIAFSRMSMLSPDGRCKAFDASADGFVRGEGAGVVALKLLSKAIADGDPIRAVIRGSAINQDGRTPGITVPSAEAQEALVLAACRDAGVDPAAIRYVEAHGTGTPVGDPIEASALGRAIGHARPSGQPCLIGSVKTNIGHLEAGAGVAGLIKLALSLEKRTVPPSLHFRTPTPHVDLAALNLRVAAATHALPDDALGPALAGINSFGFGGSNAHAILQGPPPRAVPARDAQPAAEARLLVLSAKSSERLADVAEAYRAWIAREDVDLDDACSAAATRRTHHAHRASIVGSSREQLVAGLAALAAGESRPEVRVGRVEDVPSPVAFVYAGQGTQWAGMGRELLRTERVFRDVIERVDATVRELGGWSVAEEIARPDGESRLHVTAISQPSIFALQAALTTLWRGWGIEPAAVLGHSVGEVAAAWAAGALTLEDATRVIFHRGRCMEAAPERGRMLAAALTPEQARELVAPHGGRVSLAAINAPGSVTLSGDAAPLERIAAELGARGTFHRFLDVEYAFHSAQMDPVRRELLAALDRVDVRAPSLTLVSTVRGDEAGPGDFEAEYWWRNVREAVRFGPGVEALIARGVRTFVEVGPHPALASPIAECLRARGVAGTTVGSLRRREPERAALLGSLGTLHAAGHDVAWSAVMPPARGPVALPRTPWRRERHWHELEGARALRLEGRAHPLLDVRVPGAGTAWETSLDVESHPWVADHRVQGHVLLPAAAMIETALAAARHAQGASAEGHSVVVEEVDFRKAVVVPEGEGRHVRLHFAVARDGQTFELSSRAGEADWELNATGRISRPAAQAAEGLDVEALRRRCPDEVPASVLHAAFTASGLAFGPTFRGIEVAWRSAGTREALGRIRVPEELVPAAGHAVHPALLDACLQVLSAALPDSLRSADGVYLPVQVARARLHRAGVPAWSAVRIVQVGGRALVGDVRIADAEGRVLLELEGFRCQQMPRARSARAADPDQWIVRVAWRPRPLAGRVGPAPLASAAEVAAAAAGTALAWSRGGRFSERARRAARGLDDLSHAHVVLALESLGADLSQGATVDPGPLADRLGVVAEHRRVLARFLENLVQDGVLREGDGRLEVVARPSACADARAAFRRLLEDAPALLPELTLVRRCGEALADVLRGQADPLEVIFPEGSLATSDHLYQDGWSFRAYNAMVADGLARAIQDLPAGQPLRVIEIGAGTGGMTAHVVPRLPADRTRYVFTDVSPMFFSRAEAKFFEHRHVEYRQLDVERDPAEQGFEAGSFDVVLASDALHATRDLRQALGHVRSLLAPRGLMAMLEIDRPAPWADLVFGLTKGWWRFEDRDLRPSHPSIGRHEWTRLLRTCGFSDARAVGLNGTDDDPPEVRAQVMIVAEADEREAGARASVAPVAAEDAAAPPAAAPPRTWLVLADECGTSAGLAARLRDRGDRVVHVRAGASFRRVDDGLYEIAPGSEADARELLTGLDLAGASPDAAIFGWALDAPDPSATTAESLERAERAGVHALLHLVQGLSARSLQRLLVLTRGAHAVEPGEDVAPARATTSGAARIMASEMPALAIQCVDLGASPGPAEIDALLAEIDAGADGFDPEVALRPGGRFVPRIERATLEDLGPVVPEPASGWRTRLEISSPGTLDHLVQRRRPRRAPGPGEVEIEVAASALNFRDVMKALGIYPTDTDAELLPGDECAGRVVAVGEGVGHVRPGDAVMGVGPGSLSTHVTLPAAAVSRVPAGLTPEEAVTIPVPFMTAWWCLAHVARVEPGETVLVHAATGGVGLAAIQVARLLGAEVLATAGSTEKRDLLRALGVAHVFDSRSLAFADEARAATGGRGVDVVLNSLAGEAIPKGLAALAPFGRFVEIGKRDIYADARVGLRPFRNNVSLMAVDLAQVMRDRPERAAALLSDVAREIEAGRLHALAYRAFPLEQAVAAFRHVSTARHVGKVVLAIDPARVRGEAEADRTPLAVRPDATYLVVGGLGGFGLATAEWLVRSGARTVVLASRRGAPGDDAREGIARMEAAGARVVVERLDASSREDVDALFSRMERTLPPLRGIVQAAMVIDDALVAQLDAARFAAVMAPKVQGSWNLHERSLRSALDFFVAYSSASALVGNAGQANYVAANAFVEALARHRRANGLPALTVSWGRIDEVGYVARNEGVGKRLDRIGMFAMPPALATEVLGRVLRTDADHVGVVRIDWPSAAAHERGPARARLEELADASAGDEGAALASMRTRVLEAPEAQRVEVAEALVAELVAGVLRTSAERVDRQRPLTELGLDSLMAIDLLSRLEAAFETSVPAAQLTAGASVSRLARLVVETLCGTAPAQATHAAAAPQRLLALREGGAGAPLFLMHPTGGLTVVYEELARSLPAGFPVLALPSRALGSQQPEHPTLAAMADEAAQVVAAHQPEGAVRLGGFSLGAFLALEVARRLEQQGRTVALVALVDPPVDLAAGGYGQRETVEAMIEDLFATFVRDLGVREDVDVEARAREARDLVPQLLELTSGERVERLVGWAGELGVGASMPAQLIRHYLTLFDLHAAMLEGYEPRPVAAPVVAWRSSRSANERSLSSVSLASYREIAVDADHHDLMRAPHVASLALDLATALENGV